MSKICGIYAIIAPGGVVYIGSSKNCKERWGTHSKELQNGKHPYIKYFQQSFVEKTIRFELLEKCKDEDRFELEQKWMDAYPERVNIHRHVHATGVILTEAGRRRISETSKARIVSPETRAALSRAGKGRKLSPEHKAALIKSLTGRPLSEKVRIALTKPKSAESREKTMAAIRGVPLSKEHKAKLSQILKTLPKIRGVDGRYC